MEICCKIPEDHFEETVDNDSSVTANPLNHASGVTSNATSNSDENEINGGDKNEVNAAAPTRRRSPLFFLSVVLVPILFFYFLS